MSVSTRGVLAVLIILLMVAALIAGRRGEESMAAWLMTAGFATATLWAGLGVLWTHEHGPEGAMTAELYLTLLTMGVAFTIYFGLRAKDNEGIFGSW